MSKRPSKSRYYVSSLDTANLLPPRQPSVQAALVRGPTTPLTPHSPSIVSASYFIHRLFLLSHIPLESVPLSYTHRKQHRIGAVNIKQSMCTSVAPA